MTVIRPNSVSGITSITAQANEINFFRSNGTLAGLQLNGVNFNTTTGVSTFNNLDVGGVLTYQDVTNVDSIGIITARGNVEIGGFIKHLGDTNTMIGFPSDDTFSVTTNNVTRMTFTGNFIDLPDAGTFRLGNSNDLQIYHGSGGASNIVHSNTSQPLIISATGAGSIRFDTNSNERVRIDSSGYLIAKADIRLRRTSSDNGALYFGDTNNNYIFGSDADDVITFATAGTERLRITSGGQILLGGATSPNTFNGVGGVSNLVVAGSTADTDITDNSGASLTISNTDGTANNTAGLHFAREDTDGAPHYSGASVVAQFKETMNTGQYPKADLAFLTSTANNNAPSEKMRITAAGQLCIGGTSSVGTLLHVENSSGDAYIRCRASVNKAVLFNNNDGSAHGFIGSGGTNGGTGADLAVQSNSGNIVLHTPNGGGVRMPNQICFQAVRTSGGTVPSGTYMVYNAVDVNVGNDYNNNNGYFTAAVAGTYLFHISAIAHNNSATVFRYYLRINNGNIGSGNDAHLRLDRANNAAGATYGPNGSFTYYRYMNVNDYARVYYTADNGAACYSGADYLKFAAHLVG